MLDKLQPYVEQGLLSRKVSEDGKLVLFDYTEKVQFDKLWDEVTLNHRGTVYELATGKIVARAFPKFFNWSEIPVGRQIPMQFSNNFSVYEKLDGSLGIVYYYDGTWRVNTRGSFASDQAIKAKELLVDIEEHLNSDLTYLVEIIYPENRIVVDYKGIEKLVYLAAIETDSGRGTDFEYYSHGFTNRSNVYNFATIEQVLDKLKTLPFNEEGYVVQFEDGTRAKFKGDEYVEMHRLISGLSPLTIWENMVDGMVPEEFLAKIPEEFRDRYEDISDTLELKFAEMAVAVELRVKEVVDEVLKDGEPTELRKKVGLYLKANEHPLNALVFPTVLGKQEVVTKLIMKEIRPKGNVL